ncbi:sigma-70 family RNA polymerase sigma factor [Bradyrhizobium sp. U87765 SZCCT0131]|uniref:RNA polymerase sigma factor n=1 Tax=unclassified Bradyrhizobium TaxID=2631580 RepID=UPI001BA89992|nr:sigma-70 family RNA polymerase sigma factor [Bradyrhizobium sp. U87765 SZCCT0131]MBR1260699.1 sigma-70 family RNA polymerase sigma factor [Bradyrhizobium sp. U87765 SZCCT0134]MBR1303853.1 sigma-70 family RNA polymerase sigma factor [Bradyrhizobium sp. U87765 SZCCT0110]MBR1319459.1 sigma-70 family RNA polymerase sigma factor [Bradyrhizobium sp. U87765 SZCCT0109]MBR1347784.1 sigma-70 family RNA polymerase sigma factor [Bradyrhizobium sp. U87765 SZCCT0048]
MTDAGKETSWTALRQLLVERYDLLRRRLTRRLGSADAAQETLHELYLRMERTDNVGVLQNPTSYLLTSAVNLARDRWRTEDRRASRVDVDALYELIDEKPGPDRVVEGQMTFAVLRRALDLLPPRQRDILLAVRFEGLTQDAIAMRLGISVRLVRLELQRALEFCHDYLTKNL